MNSVLLDTSFLITFADPNRFSHRVAHQYYRACLESGIPMFLSTIACSEFEVRQSISDLPLRNFIMLPFNFDEARACAKLVAGSQRDEGDDRVRVKDDMKLIAQCEINNISHILTEDKNTLVKYLSRFNGGVFKNTRAVLLKQGFDSAWFHGGQAALGIG